MVINIYSLYPNIYTNNDRYIKNINKYIIYIPKNILTSK